MTVLLKNPDDLQQLYNILEKQPRNGYEWPCEGLLKTTLQGTVSFDFKVDKWPDFTSVVAYASQEQDKEIPKFTRHRLHITCRDKDAFYNLMDHPDVIDWNKKWYLWGFPWDLIEAFKDVASKYGGSVKLEKNSNKRSLFYLEYEEREVSEEFSYRNIHPEEAHLVSEPWAYNEGKVTEDWVRFLVTHFPSVCAIDREGNMAFCAITMEDRGGAAGYAYPKYRGRESGVSAMKHLLTKQMEVGDMAHYGYVEQSNTSSLRMGAKGKRTQLEGTWARLVYEPNQSKL